jgi:hypothetical protein
MFLDDSFVDPSADDSNIETLLYSNIKPKFVFGLVTGISGNCLYLNDHVIVYPAAGVVVVHDLDAHSQRFVYPKDPRRTITAMDLSPMRYVAVMRVCPWTGPARVKIVHWAKSNFVTSERKNKIIIKRALVLTQFLPLFFT